MSTDEPNERLLLETADIHPVITYDLEYRDWLRAAHDPSAPRDQHPVDELLGEHHVMDAVLAAMEREARRISTRGEFRQALWEDFVDYLGNFVYQVHRRKEEHGLLPVYVRLCGEDAASAMSAVAKEHRQITEITLDLVHGVGEGDWEKVLRAGHLYLRLGRDHLEREEREVFPTARERLDPAAVHELRQKFDELERFGLGDRDRMYYVTVARRLCARTGLPETLD
ncbi:MAG: hemerythrin domain-containing protein [Myxococcales bacterium]|nr:hemerythrin domain-containing protein [Myxococcales bacterium]MCB9649771.1 hemerythrin domain-containing protein [Deltaproteobacteria bacterium]